jgi:single-strand DNA-binding protein
MNNIVLLGRTTAPIECKQTQSGKPVATFSLAVKRPFTKDTTDFFNITAWDTTAENLSKYVCKGDQICVRGYLQNRSWEDKQGNKRTTTDVVAQEFSFCGSKRDNVGKDTSHSANASQNGFSYVPDAYTQPNFENGGGDDSLPF